MLYMYVLPSKCNYIASDLPYFNDVLIIVFCKKVKTCIFCICIKPFDMRFKLSK